MTRVWAFFRSWGSALTTSGLWVVVAAVAAVVFVMWLAGTGFLPTGKKSAWPRGADTQPVSTASQHADTCHGRGCEGRRANPRGQDTAPVRGLAGPPPHVPEGYQTASAAGYDVAPQGTCSDNEPPPWGAPVWKNCGIRCMYERLRNGFCGPGCDYYYFRMKEYKPRRFYPRKPCYRVP